MLQDGVAQTSSLDTKVFRIAVFDKADIRVLEETNSCLPENVSIEYVNQDGSYGDTKEGQDELARIINEGDYDGAVVRSDTTFRGRDYRLEDGTVLQGALTKVSDRFRTLGRAGIGVDNIDVEEASRRGINVNRAPGSNSVAVSEQGFFQLGEFERRIGEQYGRLRKGEGAKLVKKGYKGKELNGKILTVIGLGGIGPKNIGKAIGFEMGHVYCHDGLMTLSGMDSVIAGELDRIFMSSARSRVTAVESIDDALGRGDYVFIHVPLNPGTRNYINAERIARMKPDAILVNNSRAGVVDENAVKEALESGRLRGYITDVLSKNSLLKNATGVIEAGAEYVEGTLETPHTCAATIESQENAARMIGENNVAFFGSGEIVNSVNFPTLDKAGKEQYNLVGLLAAFGTGYIRHNGGEIKSIKVIGKGIPSFDRRGMSMATASGTIYGYRELVNGANGIRSSNGDHIGRDMPTLSMLREKGIIVEANRIDPAIPGFAYTITLEYSIITADGKEDVVRVEGGYDAYGEETMPVAKYIDGFTKGSLEFGQLQYIIVEHSDVPHALEHAIGAISGAGYNIEGNINLTHITNRDETGNKIKLMVFPVTQKKGGSEDVSTDLLEDIAQNLARIDEPGITQPKVSYVDLRGYSPTFQLKG